MRLIERYLLRQFIISVLAVAAVLLLVSLGGVFADLVAEIARGKVPAPLLLSQLGLRAVRYLPMVLPLAVFLGLLLAVGRLYGDSEMAVLASVGLGPRQLWRALLLATLPVVLVIAAVSLWLAPESARLAQEMIVAANRSFIVAGLDAGRFVELPGRAGVLYVGELSRDGTRFRQMFVQSERDGRLDIITATSGELVLEGQTQRYLRLKEGFRVEGSPEQSDFRLMRFSENELRVPDREQETSGLKINARDTRSLIGDASAEAVAEWHWRLSMPLFCLVLGLMAMPLARSEPRQSRYGRLLLALLVYLLGMNLLVLGRGWLESQAMPALLGLWWLHVPAAALAAWLFWTDGRLAAPKRSAA